MWRAQWTRLLDGAEHDGDVGPQPHRVGRAVGLQPLLGVDLVRAQGGPDLVVEDLGRGAGQGTQPGVHQPPQIRRQRLAEAAGALSHLERGETVDVNVGGGLFDRFGDVDVIVAVEVGMDARLAGRPRWRPCPRPPGPARRCRPG